MKKIFLTVLCCIIFMSCNQDPIFYNISIEPPKRDPIIPGSPTKIIVLKDMMYVGSRHGKKINLWDGSSWSEIARPGGSIIDLATNGTHLCALLYNDNIMNSTMIKRYDPDTNIWENDGISLPGHSMQTIYGAGAEIFAGSYYQTSEGKWTYAILRLNVNSLEIIKEETSLLRGAAEKDAAGIFLATAGSGIFKYEAATLSGPIEGTSDIFMVGIFENEGTVFAASNDNKKGNCLHIYDAATNSFSSNSTGYDLTGAMCVWNQHESTIHTDPYIKVTPSLVTIKKGNSQQFHADVVGLDDTSVTWSISGASNIDDDGLLVVDMDETAGFSLTVTVSSAANSAIKGFAQVKVAGEYDLDGYVAITGSPVVGSTLTADTTELGGAGPISYQWKRNDELITGAIDFEEYTITPLDQGEDISVTVSRAGIDGSVSSDIVTVILPGTDPWKPTLLLIGIRGSINYQGYREILLNRYTGRPASFGIRTPGDTLPSSVTDRAKYNAGIGKHPVEGILQAPKEMYPLATSEADIPIFASTTLNGLWSYRNGEWNAEE